MTENAELPFFLTEFYFHSYMYYSTSYYYPIDLFLNNKHYLLPLFPLYSLYNSSSYLLLTHMITSPCHPTTTSIIFSASAPDHANNRTLSA